ncbi:S8 family serine peptidase [Roseofilum capinflatum]|uniref:S8 family serine peptidase n=1 Tax=Roseofilum capinflatum BLCC-M114 TaxID=3022440 RepID=A0ABT7B1Q0_9CYAN|nr:S8 family serine peptidase [Roseofilum capinflatum]MDJ1173065.1 S8 family serine peptidase [Roseofilum capinflatum BLCC-M114]
MIRFGTPENDLIVETQENDIIWGLAGEDIIASNAGNDELYGNQGNDVLLGGRGADSIWGGQDDDLIVGNPDADYVNGNLGNDTVHGGQGDDCVRGGQGNDWVSGDRGNDILYGDLGNNTLVGGPGEDLFVLGSGEDVILDFTPGQDKIGLAPGVTFDSLQVSQRGEDSVVSDRTTGAIIGIFQGIDATSLEASQFTNLLLNIPAPSPPPSVPDIPSSSPPPAPSLSILPPAAEVTPIETDPGNTLETASSISLSSNTRTFSQSVGGSDVADYYKFSLGATNTFELSLTGLTALATVDVLDEAGNVVLNGQLSNNSSVISGELPGGAYRLRITSDAPTNYLLNTRVTPQLPGITTTGSQVETETDTSESLPLIGINTLKADNRFSSVDGSGFTAVVLDTGINTSHPAFGSRLVYHEDFGDHDLDASDVKGHGTNVSSIIASADSTYPGVAPGANIIHLKTSKDSGGGNFAMKEQALQWILKNIDTYNIVSVNMSFSNKIDTDGDGKSDIRGNYQTQQTLTELGINDELEQLKAKGVILVSSAGNDFYRHNSAPGVAYPAADPNTIAIGAVYDANVGAKEFSGFGGATSNSTAADHFTPFSQRHPNLITAVAPGAQIVGADATGTGFSRVYSGTSQAAPHVAGMAVLAQQLAVQTLGRKLTPDEFATLLKDTGVSVVDGDDEDDNVINTDATYKRVDMFALAEAILDLSPTPTSPPTVTLEVTDGVAAENLDSATFTLSRTGGSIDEALTVTYTLGGTAINGTDYQSLNGTATIAAGETETTITVNPLDDTLFDGAKTLSLNLASSGLYTVGNPNSGEATIYDNETVYVSNAYTTAGETVEGGQAVVGINAFDAINSGILNTGGTNTTPGIVEVRAGTYNELVNLNKPVNLRGANAGVSGNSSRNPESSIMGRITWDGGTILTNQGTVTLDGFRIDPPDGSMAIETTGSGNNSVITNNIIENVTNEQGIFNAQMGANGLSTENLTISNNLIRNVTTTGGNTDKNGIFLLGVTGLAISGNEIRDITGITSRGINVSGIVGGSISGNTITNTTEDGIQLANNIGGFTTQNVTISDNLITAANTSNNSMNAGIRLRDGNFGSSITLSNNNISQSFNGLTIRSGTGSLANVSLTNNTLDPLAGSFAINNLSGSSLTALGNFSDLARTTALVAGDVNGTVTI